MEIVRSARGMPSWSSYPSAECGTNRRAGSRSRSSGRWHAGHLEHLSGQGDQPTSCLSTTGFRMLWDMKISSFSGSGRSLASTDCFRIKIIFMHGSPIVPAFVARSTRSEGWAGVAGNQEHCRSTQPMGVPLARRGCVVRSRLAPRVDESPDAFNNPQLPLGEPVDTSSPVGATRHPSWRSATGAAAWTAHLQVLECVCERP
jgi:hypothetical protein